MRYYIVDNRGTTHGESEDKYKLELYLTDILDDMKNKGMTTEEIKALDLEIIQGN